MYSSYRPYIQHSRSLNLYYYYVSTVGVHYRARCTFCRSAHARRTLLRAATTAIPAAPPCSPSSPRQSDPPHLPSSTQPQPRFPPHRRAHLPARALPLQSPRGKGAITGRKSRSSIDGESRRLNHRPTQSPHRRHCFLPEAASSPARGRIQLANPARARFSIPSMASPRSPPQSAPLPARSPSSTALTFHYRAGYALSFLPPFITDGTHPKRVDCPSLAAPAAHFLPLARRPGRAIAENLLPQTSKGGGVCLHTPRPRHHLPREDMEVQ
jgi:hypothetical protein